MKTLYLMRHGQTYFNVWHKIQGWCDSPLTDQGIIQAKNVRQYFKDNQIKFEKAYSSTSERACDTLELVTGWKQHDYDRLKDLREEGFGSFEAHDELLNPPVPYQDFFVKFGGESQNTLTQRVREAIFRIMENAGDHSNTLVVSHAGAIINFLGSINIDILKMPDNSFTNCSIVKLDYHDGDFHFQKIINEQNYSAES